MTNFQILYSGQLLSKAQYMLHSAARLNCERTYVPQKWVYTGKASSDATGEVEKITYVWHLFAPGSPHLYQLYAYK